MKFSKSIIYSVALLFLVSVLYRIVPGRPFGFAPQYAMAIFGGAIFRKQKAWAFILPIGSMFLSDLLYEILHRAGVTEISGFYSGQWINYILFAGLVFFGFMMKKITLANVVLASVLAPSVYFLLSNFAMWVTTNMYEKTLFGLGKCYAMGLPFYPNSVMSTLFFSAIFFGVYTFVAKKEKAVVA